MATDDESMFEELGEVLRRVDPVPPAVVTAARESYAWREVDAALARLTADSLRNLAAVRGGSGRLLTFAAGAVTIEVEVTLAGGRLRVLGQLVPPQPARVRVDQPGGSVEVAADRLGRFAVADLPAGATRFHCIPAEGEPVRTEWTLL
jgi:hypothetical protein